MNPLLASSYTLNKSATKFVYVSSDAETKECVVALCKTIDNAVIKLNTIEFQKLREQAELVTSNLRKTTAVDEVISISDDLHVKVQVVFNSKAVVIERTDSKGEVMATLYYHPPTWNNFKALFPLLQYDIHLRDIWAVSIHHVETCIIEDMITKFSNQDFKSLHVYEVQDLMTRLNPELYDIANENYFDKIRCFHELVLYYPYMLLQKIIAHICM